MHRFDTGSGPAILRSTEAIRADVWHEVKVKRKLREASLVLDNADPVVGKSPGNTRGLNIRTPVYIGGLNTKKLTYAEAVGVARGFSGCIIEVIFSCIPIFFVWYAISICTKLLDFYASPMYIFFVLVNPEL
jgi:hypothetical protein